MNEEQYDKIVSSLRKMHGELLQIEARGFDAQVRDNPALIGDYLMKLRLHCNLLFAFINKYYDVLSEGLKLVSEKRQQLYVEGLEEGKSPNAAKLHADEATRVDSANTKIVEYKIQQIKNEYERYNGICMALQSGMKEFNTERIMN